MSVIILGLLNFWSKSILQNVLKPARKPVKSYKSSGGLLSSSEQITQDPKMAAAGSLPHNRVDILERFNDTDLLNCCWVNAPLQPRCARV